MVVLRIGLQHKLPRFVAAALGYARAAAPRLKQKGRMRKEESDLKERAKQFALRIIRLIGSEKGEGRV